jgi:hypothetical protein
MKFRPKFGKIYNAKKYIPPNEPGYLILIYYNKIFTWVTGLYSHSEKQYVTDAPKSCKPLRWTPMPPIPKNRLRMMQRSLKREEHLRRGSMPACDQHC